MGSNARSVSGLQTKTGCLSLFGGVLFNRNQTNQSTFTDSVPGFSGLYQVSRVLWAAVGDMHGLPAHKGGLGTHFLQPTQTAESLCLLQIRPPQQLCCCGHIHGFRPPSCSEWQPPSPLLTGQEDTVFAAISNWVGHPPPQTHHAGVARQFLPETRSLWPAAHSMLTWPFRYSFPQKMSLIHPSPSWGTTPAACSTLKIQIICSHSVRESEPKDKQGNCQPPSQAAATTSPSSWAPAPLMSVGGIRLW